MVINLFDFLRKITHYHDKKAIEDTAKSNTLISTAIKMTDDAQKAAARVNFELDRLEKVRIV